MDEKIQDMWSADDRVKDCSTCYYKDARGDEYPCDRCLQNDVVDPDDEAPATDKCPNPGKPCNDKACSHGTGNGICKYNIQDRTPKKPKPEQKADTTCPVCGKKTIDMYGHDHDKKPKKMK